MSISFRHVRLLPCVSALLALGTSYADGVPRVFTFADRFHPMLCHLARTLEVSGGTLHVLGLREGKKAVAFFKDAESKKPKEGNPWHTPEKFTLLKKHLFLYRAIKRLAVNDTIIFVDAFDVLFQQPFNDLTRKYHELAQNHLEKHGHWPVIYGGELNCWPFPHHGWIRVPPRGANRSWVHRIPHNAALSDGQYHKTWRYPGRTGEISGDQVCQEWLAEHSTAGDRPQKRPKVGSVGFDFGRRKKLKRRRFPFLCSGAFVGKVSSLRRLLREMFLLFRRTAEMCDQALIPLLLLRFPYLGFVDKDAQLFLNLHGHDPFDLERPLCQGNYFAARSRNSSRGNSSMNFRYLIAPRLLGRSGFDNIPKLLHFNGNGKRHLSRCVKEFLDVGLITDPPECRYVDVDRNVLQMFQRQKAVSCLTQRAV